MCVFCVYIKTHVANNLFDVMYILFFALNFINYKF